MAVLQMEKELSMELIARDTDPQGRVEFLKTKQERIKRRNSRPTTEGVVIRGSELKDYERDSIAIDKQIEDDLRSSVASPLPVKPFRVEEENEDSSDLDFSDGSIDRE